MNSKYKKESLFKEDHELKIFFHSNHIRLHNAYEYLKERGIFAFPNEIEGMANLVSKFYLGIDSQENLQKYVGVKAYPYISGFILEKSSDISLDNLYNYLNAHIDKVLIEEKEGKLVQILTEHDRLIVEVEYFSAVKSQNIFDTIKRSAIFEISKINESFSISFILNRDLDYKIIFSILNFIIQKDSELKLKLIEYNYSLFPKTSQKHELLLELLDYLDENYNVLGIIRFYRDKAEDIGTPDNFEDKLRKGHQEIKLMEPLEVLKNIEERGAFIEGVDVPIYLESSNYFFIIRIKTQKERLEIGLLGDVKKIDRPELLEEDLDRELISSLEIIHLSEVEKHEILKNIWDLISIKFYDFRDKFIKNIEFNVN